MIIYIPELTKSALANAGRRVVNAVWARESTHWCPLGKLLGPSDTDKAPGRTKGLRPFQATWAK